MKKLFLRTIPMLLCAVMLFSSCSKLPEFAYKDGAFVNEKTGISYLPAGDNYEAIALQSDKEVARIIQKGMDDIVMYPISGIDSEKMLTNELYEVFYAEGTKLPTLWEMDPEQMHICRTVTLTYSLATVTSAAELEELIDIYRNGKGFSENEIDVGLDKERYDLKFQSSAYEGIYYCLIYWEFEDEVLVYEVIEDFDDFEITYPDAEVTTEEYKGEKYAVYHFGTSLIYDRTTKTCYPVGDLLSKYLQDDAA